MNRMTACLVVCVAAWLVACAGPTRNTAPPLVYDFGLPVAPVGEPIAGSGWILEVRSPPWFDSLGIDYRLAYDDPLKPREYVTSRWAANPGVLLAQRLRQQLGMSGSTSGVASDCLLRVEVQEFSQVFDSPQDSRGVVLAAVSLIDGKRRVVAERRFFVEKAATSADARGGVAALVLAGTELGHQLATWLADPRQVSTLGTCRFLGN